MIMSLPPTVVIMFAVLVPQVFSAEWERASRTLDAGRLATPTIRVVMVTYAIMAVPFLALAAITCRMEAIVRTPSSVPVGPSASRAR